MVNPYFLNNKIIYCNDTGEKCTGYKEYLQSKHWALLRKKYIKSNTVCASCGSKDNLQLHHVSYKNLGNEFSADFLVLCDKCHKNIHKMKDHSREFNESFSPKSYIKLSKERKKKHSGQSKAHIIGKGKNGRKYYSDYLLTKKDKQRNKTNQMKFEYWPNSIDGYAYCENYGSKKMTYHIIPRYDCEHQKSDFVVIGANKYYYVYCELGRVFCNKELCQQYISATKKKEPKTK